MTTAEADLRRAFDSMGSRDNPAKTQALGEEPAKIDDEPEAQAVEQPVAEGAEIVAATADEVVEQPPVEEEEIIELAVGKKVRFPSGDVMPVQELTGYEKLKSTFSREQQKLRQAEAQIAEERRRIQEDREFLDIAAKTPWIATGLQAIRTGADPKAAFKAAAIAGGYEPVVAPQPEPVDQRSQWPPVDVTQESDPVEYEKRYAAHIEWKTEQAIGAKLKAFEDRTLAVLQERDRKAQEAEAAKAAAESQAKETLQTNYERLTSELFPYLPFDISTLSPQQQEQVFERLGTVATQLGTPLDNIAMSQRIYMPNELRYVAEKAFQTNPFKPQVVQQPIPGKPPVPTPGTPLAPGQGPSQTKPATTGSSAFGDGVKELLSLQPV